MMNERIKELAEQAGCLNDPNRHLFLLGEDHLEWFAKLLVQECMNISASIGEHGHIASEEMGQHFGVE